MKKSSQTLLLVAGAAGIGLYFLQKERAKAAAMAAAINAAAPTPEPATLIAGNMLPGMNGADVLLTAPTGETVSSSGQVLGWLGEGYETNDTYDAAPRQYMSRVINDLSGFGDTGSRTLTLPSSMQPLKPAVVTTATIPSAPPATPGVRMPAAAVAASSPAAAGAVAVGASQGYILVEQYGGNHSIWSKNGQYVTDYTTVPRPGFTLGPFASVAQAEQAIDGGAPPAAAPAPVASQVVTSSGAVPAAQVIASSPAAAGAAAVGAAAGLTLIEQYGGNHSIWNSPTGYVTDYTTVPSPTYTLGPFSSVAAAEQAIDQAGWTLAASTMTQAPTYNGQIIYTMTPAPGQGVVYLVNPPQPANPSTQMPTSGTGFASSYPTMAAAQAAIDAAVAAQAPIAMQQATSTAPITVASGTAVGGYTVNFAQAYGGHTVSVATPSDPTLGGTVYLIDYVVGTAVTPASGYPTMLAATQAIDAMNAGQIPATSAANPYAADPGTTLSTSDGTYSYDSGASSGTTTSDGSTPVQYAQPAAVAAPASGGGTLLALVGAGVVGAGAWFLSK